MDAGPKTDESLMAQVVAGQQGCLTPLVRRYASPLLTFIQRMIGDRHRSEDLFQEVFLAVWRNRRRYEFPRPFRAWLFGIAVNTCRADFRRRAAPVVSLDQDDPPWIPPAADPPAGDVITATETTTLATKAVGQLPARQRAVVVLRVWSGMSYAEIAQILGTREATVRSNMHHGLAAMRGYLEPRLR